MQILHVDDEPDIREVAAISLGLDPEMTVRSVGSGAEAMDCLADGWMPDVVLLDVMMPGLDGPGTLERIRQSPVHRNIPIIFMTARAQADERTRLMNLGAIGIIIKPFDPMTLAHQVRHHLEDAIPRDHLGPLRDRFRLRCQDDLARLRILMDGEPDGEALGTLVHNLAGAAGVFGFSALSEAAIAIDDHYAARTLPDIAQFAVLEQALIEAAKGSQ